jgi:hypothetical protein
VTVDFTYVPDEIPKRNQELLKVVSQRTQTRQAKFAKLFMVLVIVLVIVVVVAGTVANRHKTPGFVFCISFAAVATCAGSLVNPIHRLLVIRRWSKERSSFEPNRISITPEFLKYSCPSGVAFYRWSYSTGILRGQHYFFIALRNGTYLNVPTRAFDDEGEANLFETTCTANITSATPPINVPQHSGEVPDAWPPPPKNTDSARIENWNSERISEWFPGTGSMTDPQVSLRYLLSLADTIFVAFRYGWIGLVPFMMFGSAYFTCCIAVPARNISVDFAAIIVIFATILWMSIGSWATVRISKFGFAQVLQPMLTHSILTDFRWMVISTGFARTSIRHTEFRAVSRSSKGLHLRFSQGLPLFIPARAFESKGAMNDFYQKFRVAIRTSK